MGTRAPNNSHNKKRYADGLNISRPLLSSLVIHSSNQSSNQSFGIMHPWKQFLRFLLLVQASSAFTVQRSTLLPDSFPAATHNSRNEILKEIPFRRKGPVHSSTTADQGESDFQSSVVEDASLKSENAKDLGSDGKANTSNVDSGTAAPNIRSLPWSDVQEWALRDNLPRYTRRLPGEQPKTYALWRTMLQDVPELSGYPIDFLQTKCEPLVGESSSQTKTNSGDSETKSSATKRKKLEGVPEMLPYLDNFYFEPSGGLSGQVYGVRGLRDGTVIETSPVGQVEVTIPLGYVLTEDIGIAYEIGSPLQSDQGVVNDSEAYSMSGVTRKAGQVAGSVNQAAASNLAAMARQASSSNGSRTENDESNALLVQLGASTGLLLAGATAVSLLSHHLTVNVFWV